MKKYPEGHFLGLGIAIGIPLGIPIGLALGNIALGPALGVAIGVSIGVAMEENAKKKRQIRKLTPKEEKARKRNIFIGLGALILGLVAGVTTFFLVK